MRTFVSLTILVLIIFVSGLYLTGYYYPCDHPITYKLGSVDPRFNLTAPLAQKNIDEAAQIWNDAYDKTILKPDPQAKLTVNFVYDERQKLSSQVSQMEENTGSEKTALTGQVAIFNAKMAAFGQKVSALNSEIAQWNARGGAPKEVYDKLVARQNDLKNEETALRAEATRLQVSIDNFNFQIEQLNSTVDTFNAVISQKPEAGLFDGEEQTIYIYYVDTAAELAHTLAHEFGHTMNIDHVNEPQAIMFPYRSKSVNLSDADKDALRAACRKIQNVDLILSYYENLKN